MKKGQICVGTVEELLFPDQGRTLLEDEAAPEARQYVYVKHALPGQKIRLRITKVRKGKKEGQLLEILVPSPLETGSDCPHFGDCGGCLLRSLPYDRQLAIKEQQALTLLRGACGDPRFEGIIPSPVYEGYRNKMEFSFGDAYLNGPLSLGMHKRGSFYDIVTADHCRIAGEDMCSILSCVLALCSQMGLTYYHRTRHTGYLRHLLVRKARHTGEILVDLVTTGQWENVSKELPAGTEALKEGQETDGSEAAFEERLVSSLLKLPLEGRITGILHTRNDAVADVIRDEGTAVLYGNDHFSETLLGLRFGISPFSFFQTNSAGAEVLYEKVREYVGDTKDKVIFDLYSGTGTIAQILAPVSGHVTGVEIVEEAVEAARENARVNGLKNCDFIAGDVLRVLDTLEEKPDIIVLDPPREGIHPKALPKIVTFGVSRMIYISCKLTSLVRDLEYLQQAGYSVKKSVCVDMFPAAGGIETVCLLARS